MLSQGIVIFEGLRAVATFFTLHFNLSVSPALVVDQNVFGNESQFAAIARENEVCCDDFFIDSVQIRFVRKIEMGDHA